MHLPRHFWLLGLLLCGLAPACTDGQRGSAGFDITNQARFEAASRVAVSNLHSPIELGQAANGASTARSAPLGDVLRTADAEHRRVPRGARSEDLQCDENDVCLECIEEEGVYTATTFLIGAPRGAECPSECRRDEVFLSSADPRTCDGAVRDDIPVDCGFRNFSRVLAPGEALLIEFDALFEPSEEGTGCATPQSFGLITPAFNVCTGASKGTLTLDGFRSDLETGVDGQAQETDHRFVRFTNFTVDLVATGSPCVVNAILSGQVDRRSRVTGERFSALYNNFQVTEEEIGEGIVLVTQDGTLSTDCLGDLEYETIEPLRLEGADACPTAGLLRITLADGAMNLTRYTETGGVELDFDADGEPDKVLETCTDPSLHSCQGNESADLCRACAGDADCGDGLVCLPCSFECTGETWRCVATDDLAGCEDGVY